MPLREDVLWVRECSRDPLRLRREVRLQARLPMRRGLQLQRGEVASVPAFASGTCLAKGTGPALADGGAGHHGPAPAGLPVNPGWGPPGPGRVSPAEKK